MSYPINLSDVPFQYFDQALWSEFNHANVYECSPVQALNYKPLVYELLTPRDHSNFNTLSELRSSLIDDFKRQIISGRVILTGYLAGSDRPAPIPAGLVGQLELNFSTNEARCDTHYYVAVTVSRPPAVATSSSHERLVTWVVERRNGKYADKPTLKSEAGTALGSLTNAAFDKAFKEVFQLPRGKTLQSVW